MPADIATREAEKSRLEILVDQAQKLRPHLQQLGVKEERFIRIVTNELQRNSALAECTPPSLFAAVLRSAELNLEPGPLGLAWFIPRRINGVNQVTWQLGYKGIVELASRAGITIQTGVVHEGEHFVETLGTNASIEHRPHPNPEGKAIAYYAVATLPDGRKLHRVLSLKEIDERRKAGRTKLEPGKPWHDWPEMMARKTAVLAMKGMLPLSAEMRVALQADEQVQTVGLSGLQTVPDAPALTAGGETVDRKTGEIIEQPSPPRGEGSAVSGLSAGGATTESTQDVAAADPEHSAPEEGERSQRGAGAAVVDVTPEPETVEPAPNEQPPHEADVVTHTDDSAPARATSDQIDMLKMVADEYSWSPAQTFTSFGVDGWDDPSLTFDHATAQLHLWISNLERWRANRRSRLVSAAAARNIDLIKLLSDRELPLAGELDARTAQSLIDELEAVERPSANQPSKEEARSASTADSTGAQDPKVREQFDAMMSVSFAGNIARARYRDQMLAGLGVESLDDITNEQLRAEMVKLQKRTS